MSYLPVSRDIVASIFLIYMIPDIMPMYVELGDVGFRWVELLGMGTWWVELKDRELSRWNSRTGNLVGGVLRGGI